MMEDDQQSDDDSPSRSSNTAGSLDLMDPESGHDLTVLVERAEWRTAIGEAEPWVARAVAATLARFETGPVDLSVVLTDDARVQALNRGYRGQDKPTNVLSFPQPDGVTGDGTESLGDVILALETVEREAAEQDKSHADHTAHLVVHGTLHLLGLDHQDAGEAAEMEALEREIMESLGIADPYADQDLADQDLLNAAVEGSDAGRAA